MSPKTKIKQPRKRTKKKNQENWQQVKAELRPKFIDAGITRCELQWPRCTDRLFLTFAHSLRRRKIDKYDGKERARLFREVIRACSSCHGILDGLEHDETTKIVRQVIEERVKPV
jgi:hypothetical protein